LKHAEDSYKHIIEEIVRQVGYLPEQQQLYSAVLANLCYRWFSVQAPSRLPTDSVVLQIQILNL